MYKILLEDCHIGLHGGQGETYLSSTQIITIQHIGSKYKKNSYGTNFFLMARSYMLKLYLGLQSWKNF